MEEEKIIVSKVENKAEKAAEPQPAPETPPEGVPEAKKKNFLKTCFLKKNLIKTISVLAALLIVVGGILYYFSYNSAVSVAERYCKATCYEIDYSVIIDLSAYDYKSCLLRNYRDEEEFFEKQSVYFDEDITSWKDYAKAERQQCIDYYEEDCGKYTITAEATKEKDISLKKLKSEVRSWDWQVFEKYGGDEDTITACKVVTVKIRLDGTDDSRKTTMYCYLVKIHGKWKVIDTEEL